MSNRCFIAVDCPDRAEALVEETGAADCVVVRGSMRIIAREGDNVDYAKAGILDGLEIAMINDQVDVPSGILGLIYLGDTEDEALANFGGNDVIDSDGDGVPDAEDAFPHNPFEDKDTDSDGFGDVSGLFITQTLLGIVSNVSSLSSSRFRTTMLSPKTQLRTVMKTAMVSAMYVRV
jgi:hypothetical protein